MSKPYKSKSRQCKYEVMFVVAGDMSKEQSRQEISNLLDMLSSQKNYSERSIHDQPLAYEIRGHRVCHRFIVNFEMEDPSILPELDRLSKLNKSILRHLVINESKDRSFRATNNPKKLRDSEIRKEKRVKYVKLKSSKIPQANAS